MEQREGETNVQFTMRRIRAQYLEEVRDRIMSLQPDASAIKAGETKVGFVAGHASMRYAARDLITNMLDEP